MTDNMNKALADALAYGTGVMHKSDYVAYGDVHLSPRDSQSQHCPNCEAQAAEIEADVERLREALKGVMPYVLSEYLQCNGDKCRHLTCASCFGEDTAGKHSDKATEAKRTALATLEARKTRAALGETK